MSLEIYELSEEQVNSVSGANPIALAALVLGTATFLMVVGERLHDAHCTEHR